MQNKMLSPAGIQTFMNPAEVYEIDNTFYKSIRNRHFAGQYVKFMQDHRQKVIDCHESSCIQRKPEEERKHENTS